MKEVKRGLKLALKAYCILCALFVTCYFVGDFADGLFPRREVVTGIVQQYTGSALDLSPTRLQQGKYYATVWLSSPADSRFIIGEVGLILDKPADASLLGKVVTGTVQHNWFVGSPSWIGSGKLAVEEPDSALDW